MQCFFHPESLCIVAITFAVSNVTAKLDFLFLPQNFRKRRFSITVCLSKCGMRFFFLMSKTFSFSPPRSTVWLLFGIFESPEPLLLCLSSKIRITLELKRCETTAVDLITEMAINRLAESAGWRNRPRPEWGRARLHHATQKSVQFKTLFSGISHLIFSNHGKWNCK